MTKLTPQQQRIWDSGFKAAIRLTAKGPKNKRFWDDRLKKLAKQATKRRTPA